MNIQTLIIFMVLKEDPKYRRKVTWSEPNLKRVECPNFSFSSEVRQCLNIFKQASSCSASETLGFAA